LELIIKNKKIKTRFCGKVKTHFDSYVYLCLTPQTTYIQTHTHTSNYG